MENDQVKLLWVFRIQTAHHLEHNWPDIVKLQKASRACQIIYVVCPFDIRIVENEQEKIDHYQNLKVEIQKMWNCKSISVAPIVIGALGAVTKNLMMWVTKIGTPGILNLLQKACLLGTAKILRRTLGT